jgi:hypothetical protein
VLKFQVSIGTPSQPVALQIDTGSSDLWVQVPTSAFCKNTTNACDENGGTYDNTSSSSFRHVNNDFAISYGDGSTAMGDYALETFEIGSTHPLLSMLTVDAQVKNLQFGRGLVSNANPAVMGIGYPANEAIVLFENKTAYPNLIDQMFSQGIVESRTYSLYLNDLEASTGTILFGGVDLQGFEGTLQTLPINPPGSGPIAEFFITLTGISLTPPSGCSTAIGLPSLYPANVMLDSGTTFIFLPTPVANHIAADLGAKVDKLGKFNLPNCDLQFADGSLNFNFSGVKISVPYREFILNQDGTCSLGLRAIDGNCGILGDTFLRSAYVVYDLVCSSSSHFNSRITTRSHWPKRGSMLPQVMSNQFRRGCVKCPLHR